MGSTDEAEGLQDLVRLAEERLGRSLSRVERDFLRQMMARAWTEGHSQGKNHMAAGTQATLNDVMMGLEKIETRIGAIETAQKAVDERVTSIEKAERSVPWKFLGAIAGGVGLLLIPTISTLVVVGRREAQMDRLLEDVQSVASDVHELQQQMGTLSTQDAARATRIEDDRRRLDTLENVINDLRTRPLEPTHR